MITSSLRRVVVLTSVTAACVFAGFAARGGAFQTGKPATIPVRAVMDDGSPVLDLKPADVTIKLAGKAREVKALTLVKVGAAGDAAKPAGAAVPAPYSTNTASAGGSLSRVVMLMVDEESISPGRERAVEEAVTSLLGSLSAGDRVGFVTVPRGTINIAPSTDYSAVQTAVQGLVGKASASDDLDAMLCRTSLTLKSARDTVLRMPTDEPAVGVLIASGLIGAGSGTSCQINAGDYNGAGVAIQTSPASFFVVQLPDALPALSAENSRLMSDGMAALANTSNGTLLRFTGKGEGVMARVARETSAYYVASFDPDPADRTGAAARIEVKVVRDKVKGHAPTSITVEKEGASAKNTPPKDMLRDLKAYRDLPLRATAFSARNQADDKIRVTVFFESPGATAPLASTVIGWYDEKGKLVAQWNSQAADLAKSPSMAISAVPAGTYRMRVGAADSTGKSGAVDDTFVAALTPVGPLKLGSVTLWAPGAAGIQPRLQFKDEAEAIVLFELYGNAQAAGLSAKIEIAATPDGAAIGEPTLPGVSGNPSPDMFILAAKVPIAALAPGDYVIRVTVTVPNQPDAKIMKTLRKVK